MHLPRAARTSGQAPEWTAAGDKGPPVVDTGSLGQPLLRLGDRPGPSIFFSEAGGLLWGALAGDRRVGLERGALALA